MSESFEADLLHQLIPSEFPDDVDDFRFEYTEEEETDQFTTAENWSAVVSDAMKQLHALVSNASPMSSDFSFTGLRLPSVHEMVDAEIARHMDGTPLSDLKSINLIEAERGARINAIDLPTMRMKDFAESSAELIKSIRNNLPPANILENRVMPKVIIGVNERPVVCVQVYRPINHRETKLVGFELSLENTLKDLYLCIEECQPESKMFDGPTFAGSGMIIIDNDMYVTGPEDYSAPYVSWATQYSIPHAVHSMEDITLGCIDKLPSLVASGRCCFLIFCGNEMRRIYFSDLSLKPVPENALLPSMTYRRRLGKSQRCCLCNTGAASLVIVNDVMLPQNPSHCCNPCYRRLRSGPNGEFQLPDENVIVSPFSVL
jgi:hypothetical protein